MDTNDRQMDAKDGEPGTAPEPVEHLATLPADREIAPDELWGRLAEKGPYDIVVGINAKNVETTIIHVLNVVCTGLQHHFPGVRALVVVCDGGSTDRTRELAQFVPSPSGIETMVIHQLHGPGKGNGVRTILEIAQAVDARAVACVDGDLVSIQPTWIDNLLRPILYGLSDMVAPYYLRDKWDSVITNHLCYPLTAALYGTSVRQPIGGDYSFSRRCADHLLANGMPGDFGIDIFATTTAIAEGFRIQEAPLGIKVHASTTGYTDPKQVLSRMYVEVVGSLLDLASRYEVLWRHPDARAPVLLSEHVVPYYARLPPATRVNRDSLAAIFQEGIKEYDATLKELLPPDLYKALQDSLKGGLTAETWAKIVYAVAAWHVAAREGKSGRPADEHIHALGAIGMGRFLHFVEETRDMQLKEAYGLIKDQASTFSDLKPWLIERINALRGVGGRQSSGQHEGTPRGAGRSASGSSRRSPRGERDPAAGRTPGEERGRQAAAGSGERRAR